MKGVPQLEKVIYPNNNVIDVQNLNGLYAIQLKSANGVWQSKLLVK